MKGDVLNEKKAAGREVPVTEAGYGRATDCVKIQPVAVPAIFI